MAVEKLILRSILYGADKIPDSWFEKLPGGFYKDAEGHTRKIGDKNGQKSRRGSKHDRRKADYEYFYLEKDRSARGRRRERDRGRSRSSYDGGADDEYYYYSGDGKPHRSRSHKRRRSLDDNNRYGYDDGHGRGRRGAHGMGQPYEHSGDRNERSAHPSKPDYGRRRSAVHLDRPPTRLEPHPFGPGSLTPAAAAEPSNPAGRYPAPMPNRPRPPQTRNGDISGGYVPYAHIYGTSRLQSYPQGDFPTPALDDSVGPTSREKASPMGAAPWDYQQYPPAQRVSTVREAEASFAYSGHPKIIPRDSRDLNGHGPGTSNGFDSYGHERRSRRDRYDDSGYSKAEKPVNPRQ